MKIFESLQTSAPSGCEGMSQFINESDATVQVSKQGDYIGPKEVVIAFDNSFIERGIRTHKLRKVEFDVESGKSEPKASKKFKKQDIDDSTLISTEENISEETQSSSEEDSVVATEPTES